MGQKGSSMGQVLSSHRSLGHPWEMLVFPPGCEREEVPREIRSRVGNRVPQPLGHAGPWLNGPGTVPPHRAWAGGAARHQQIPASIPAVACPGS